MATRRVDIEGAAHLVLPDGLAHLRPDEAVLEGMLEGWARQQGSRQLSITTIEQRDKQVRRFASFTNDWPWRWTPMDVEDWTTTLRSGRSRAHSTLRGCRRLEPRRHRGRQQRSGDRGRHLVRLDKQREYVIGDQAGRPIGRMDAVRWRTFVDQLNQLGVIDQRFDPADLYTNDYLPADVAAPDPATLPAPPPGSYVRQS